MNNERLLWTYSLDGDAKQHLHISTLIFSLHLILLLYFA